MVVLKMTQNLTTGVTRNEVILKKVNIMEKLHFKFWCILNYNKRNCLATNAMTSQNIATCQTISLVEV